MKKLLRIMTIAFLTMVMVGCTSESEDFLDDMEDDSANQFVDSSVGDDLSEFDVVFDYTTLTESETIPSDESDESYDDYVEHSTFTNTINITFSEGAATVNGSVEGVSITTEGAHVVVNSDTKKVEYVLSGTASNGSFKIYSSNKFKLTLNNLTLTNTTGAAINVQSKKRVFVCLTDGTTNTLTDGTTYNKVDGEDMKACFFSEGQLLFSGSGTLNVIGNYKHGICSDDYIRLRPGVNISVKATAGNGLKANDAVFINGGVLNIETTADASKGISCDGLMTVSGGRTTIITTGGGELDDDDVSGCAAIKCDSTFIMTGGTLALKSTGAGGKGINVDQTLTISGGDVSVITTGKQYVVGSLDTSPKGIKSDADLTISGGTVKVRTSGGEGSEGIESKAKMQISGGTVEVSAYDDALNASSNITISGGSVYAYSSGNDGIDSNGTLTLSGGTVVCSGTQTPEGGFDCDQNNFMITGGTIIGIGGDSSTPTTSSCTQPVIMYSGTVQAGLYVSVLASDGNPVVTYKVPRDYQQMTMLISSPSLTKGSTFTLSTGGQVSGGSAFHGLTSGGTWSDGSSVASLTLSSMVTSVGSGGGINGGGQGQSGNHGGQPGGNGRW